MTLDGIGLRFVTPRRPGRFPCLPGHLVAVALLLTAGCTADTHTIVFDVPVSIDEPWGYESTDGYVALFMEWSPRYTDVIIDEYDVLAENRVESAGSTTLHAEIEWDWPFYGAVYLVGWLEVDWGPGVADGLFHGTMCEPCALVRLDEPFVRVETVQLRPLFHDIGYGFGDCPDFGQADPFLWECE